MASNVYECLFLLDSNRYARDPSAVAGRLADTITKFGGEMLASRLWNEQKLAYPIGNHRKGTYWLAYFRLDSLKQTELNQAFRLNEDIMRNLILKVDPRLVDAVVSHAVGDEEAKATDGEQESQTDAAKTTEATKTGATADA